MSHYQLETRYYKLERLVKWEHKDEVNEMLLNNVSPHQVSAWCKERGFNISHPKLYEYKDMLQEAIARQITVERLMGIGLPKRKPIQLANLGLTNTKQLVKNEMEVLDGIIHLGFAALQNDPQIRVQDAMKAIELKNKLLDGRHGGLTGHGLDQLRELETAKFQAVLDVVLAYLPEDKHHELEEAISNAEREFYETKAPELLEEYEKAMEEELQALPQNTVVSDSKY